jgi:hypothetical protein
VLILSELFVFVVMLINIKIKVSVKFLVQLLKDRNPNMFSKLVAGREGNREIWLMQPKARKRKNKAK